VSQFGDVWELGRHRLVCGDPQRGETYERLLGGELAEMMVTDPSYAVQVNGHAMGRGKVRPREFSVASGEISGVAFSALLDRFIRSALSASRDGAIHYIFMDWRHLHELLGAALPLYSEWKDLLVWNKTTASHGSFYRSKHELITVFKSGTGPHINNFELGGKGRYRTNVLDYPGVNGLHPARQGDLELHPTVKPVALIADLIRDCSRRNGLILDPFGGNGTTILAAERTGRIARVAELDPLDVDFAIRRWQKVTGLPARHAETDLAFVDRETRPDAPSPTSPRSAQSQRRASRR
jgi:DNA modification methylase